MLNDRKNIDDLFHNKLDGFEKDLPGYIWDNVNEELKKKKRRKRMFFYYGIAASFALLLSFGTGYFLNNNNDQGNNVIADNTATILPDIQAGDQDISSGNIESSGDIRSENAVRKFTAHTAGSVTTEDKESSSAIISGKRDHSVNGGVIKIAGNADMYMSMDAESVTSKNIKSLFSGAVIREEDENSNNDSDNKQVFIEQIFKDTPADTKKQLFLQAGVDDNDLLAMNQNSEPGKWSVGGRLSPTFVTGTESSPMELKNDPVSPADNSGSYISSLISGNETAQDKAPVILTGGLNVQYDAWKNCGVRSGFYYSKIGFSYKFLEVPFIMNYKVINRQVDLNAIGGISPGLLIGVYDESGSMMNYSSVTGLGLEYALSSKIALNMEPVIKYAIPINRNYFTINHPLSFSVFTGVSYNF